VYDRLYGPGNKAGAKTVNQEPTRKASGSGIVQSSTEG
jgi:hypothetical protein